MNKNYALIREAGFELKYDLSSTLFFDYYDPYIFVQRGSYSESSKSYVVQAHKTVEQFRKLYFRKLPISRVTNRQELLDRRLCRLAIVAKKGGELDLIMLTMIRETPAILAIKEAKEIAAALPLTALQAAATARRL